MSDGLLRVDYPRLESVYGPLDESIRRLVDLSMRTEADAATSAAAKDKSTVPQTNSTTLRGREPRPTAGAASRIGRTGVVRVHARRGIRRPAGARSRRGICPDPGPRAGCNGPQSGSVHLRRHPCVTGVAPGSTALARGARVERTEGVKTSSGGHIADGDGVTVEAEGFLSAQSRDRHVVIAARSTSSSCSPRRSSS